MSAAVMAAALNAANGQLFLKNAADLLNYSNILSSTTTPTSTTVAASQSASNSSLSSTCSNASSSSSSLSSSPPISNEQSQAAAHRRYSNNQRLEQFKALTNENQKLLASQTTTTPAGVIINKFNNLHLLQSIVNGNSNLNSNGATKSKQYKQTNFESTCSNSSVELSPLSASSSSSSVSSSSPSSSLSVSSSSSSSIVNSSSSNSSSSLNSFSNNDHLGLVPEALQRLMTSDLMYKCTETNLMESIRSIKVDLNASDVCQVSCGLLEKWCFLMVDWARQSLYFKDIKVGLYYYLKKRFPRNIDRNLLSQNSP
jgi:hypothetical protein